MKWRITVAVAFSLFLAFFITDYSSGSRGMEETVATGRRYVPKQQWFTTSTDSEGHTTIDYHEIAEQWCVTFSNGMDLDVGSGIYHAVEVGQRCFIAYRVGRWTKIRYLKNVRLDLDPKGPLEQ